MKSKKIGILGGSFNPIQNDHIKIANESLKHKLVDEVWLMPTKIHPFEKNLISPSLRLHMIKLAIEKYPKIKICDLEINDSSSQKSYTANSLRLLRSLYPENIFYFIMGSDNLSSINKWHDFEYLKNNVEFIIHVREGYNLSEKLPIKVYGIVSKNISNISSSLVRMNLSKGKSIKNLIPKEIESFIHSEGLYKNGK